MCILRTLFHTFLLALMLCVPGWAQQFTPVQLDASASAVQPMTGIVLWGTNEKIDEELPIQLEFSYIAYNEVIKGPDQYDYSMVESILASAAKRRRQAIIRFYDTYVGKPSGVPDYIKKLDGYKEIVGKSEGKNTGFPNWENAELQNCILKFFAEFAKRYDKDRRLAFLQVGFGLWSEYHIYEGPMKLGQTFPSKEFQARFLKHMATCFNTTQWMISVDAAGDHTPIVEESSVMSLPFGLFDDSINHKKHAKENEPNWQALGLERWKKSACGGEFSFFQKVDQVKALAPQGPHGQPFEELAKKFHLSFVIGDDQPRFQSAQRLNQAGRAMGYQFVVTKLERSGANYRGTILNRGVAPIYYDAFPAVGEVKAQANLKGLLPGSSQSFELKSEGPLQFKIDCQRLVPGQSIGWDVDLSPKSNF